MFRIIEFLIVWILYINIQFDFLINAFMKSFNGIGEEINMARLEYYVCFRIPLIFVLGAKFTKSDDDSITVFTYGNKHWKIKITD